MTSTKICQHEPCDCKVEGDARFCSAACEKSQKDGDQNCHCGHGHCAACD